MSSTTSFHTVPSCDTATSAPTSKLVLTFDASTTSPSAEISMATLSTVLSEQTIIRLGGIDDESDAAAHSASPPDFRDRCILVFWQNEPALYSADLHPAGCVLSPARHGARFSATEPAILIDPRSLENASARIDFTSGVISPAEAPEATDGTSKTSHKTSGGSMQHSKASGSGSGQGGKQGGDGTPSKGSQGGTPNRPSSYTSYNAGISSAVDTLTELPPMVIGAVEFLTFFPHHTQWPTVLFRLHRNGWTTGAIAKLMLHARGALDRPEWDRRQAALRHQIRTATRDKYGNVTPTSLRENGHPDFQPFTNHSSGNNLDHYDVRNPMEPSGDTYDPPRGRNTRSEPATLQDIVNGVVNWPTGEDCGQLTRALQYAQANGLLQQTTRDLPNIVAQQNYAPTANATTTQWDLRGVERTQNAVANP